MLGARQEGVPFFRKQRFQPKKPRKSATYLFSRSMPHSSDTSLTSPQQTLAAWCRRCCNRHTTFFFTYFLSNALEGSKLIIFRQISTRRRIKKKKGAKPNKKNYERLTLPRRMRFFSNMRDIPIIVRRIDPASAYTPYSAGSTGRTAGGSGGRLEGDRLVSILLFFISLFKLFAGKGANKKMIRTMCFPKCARDDRKRLIYILRIPGIFVLCP